MFRPALSHYMNRVRLLVNSPLLQRRRNAVVAGRHTLCKDAVRRDVGPLVF
jgi:hypothetical protein